MPLLKDTASGRRWALTATLLACVTASVSAQAATSASLSLNDMRFTLVDLTPNDGIRPSATFSGGGIAMTTGGNLDSPTMVSAPVQGQWLPPIDTTGGFGSGSAGGSSISMAATLDSATDVAMVPDTPRHLQLRGGSRVEVRVLDGSAPEMPVLEHNEWTITLGANTGIRFDASYTLDLTASRSQTLEVVGLAMAQADPTRTVLGVTPSFYASASLSVC